MNKDWKIFGSLAGIFLAAYFLPLGDPRVTSAIYEAFRLLQWYVREHTLACVVPAMFIAGAIATFLSQASVMRYLGPRSNRALAYSVASVSGCILAVCSCSVLPMFAGIYTMGAGLGPASAFLYSGPAINVMAIFLSARVLGLEIGLARAFFSIGFAFVIGLIMAAIFRRAETKRAEIAMAMPEAPKSARSLLKTTLFFAGMILFLVFSDWYNTNDVTIAMNDGSVISANVRYSTKDALDIQEYDPQGHLKPDVRRLGKSDIRELKPVPGFTMTVHRFKWHLAGFMGLAVLIMTVRDRLAIFLVKIRHQSLKIGLSMLPLLRPPQIAYKRRGKFIKPVCHFRKNFDRNFTISKQLLLALFEVSLHRSSPPCNFMELLST